MFAKAKALFQGGQGSSSRSASTDRYSADFTHTAAVSGHHQHQEEGGSRRRGDDGGVYGSPSGSVSSRHSVDGGRPPFTSPSSSSQKEQQPTSTTRSSAEPASRGSSTSSIKAHGSPVGMHEQFTHNVAQSVSHMKDLERSSTAAHTGNGDSKPAPFTPSPSNPHRPTSVPVTSSRSSQQSPQPQQYAYEGSDGGGGGSAVPSAASRFSLGAGMTSFPVLRSDPGLKRMGDRMTTIHREFDAKAKKQLQDVTKLEHPRMKERISELQQEIKRLKHKEAEHASSNSNTATLRHMEDVTLRIKSIQDQIDEIKRKMYFGDTKYTFGSDGVYYAAGDISVELISGQIVLDAGAYMAEMSRPLAPEPRGREASVSGAGASKRLSGTFPAGGAAAATEPPLQAQVRIQLIGKPPEDRPSRSNGNHGSDGSGQSKRSSFVASASDLLSHLSMSQDPSSSSSLSSSSDVSPHGVTIKLRLDGFIFKSENSSLPSLHLDELDLVLIVKIESQLIYTDGAPAGVSTTQQDQGARRASFSGRPDQQQQQQQQQQPGGERGRAASSATSAAGAASGAASVISDDEVIKKGSWAYSSFLIDIIDFKGPFAIGRSVLSAIVNLITPKLKAAILSSFPVEIGGMLINNLAFHNGAACWGTARGYFSLHGTRLHFLSQEMKTSAELARALDMMPEHLHMFRSMQKSVGVPVHLKTLSDVARYMRKFSADPKLWDELKGLWCEAMEIYVEKLTMTHYESVKGLPQYPIVERILKLTEDVERKPLKLELRLSYVDGQISLKRALAAAVSWLFRKANRDAALWVDTGLMKGASVDVETVKVNEKKTLYKEHIERTAILSLLKIYITSCGADVGFRLHSGGEINIAMRRGEATLPVTYLASSPLNPFSSGFSDVGGYMLGVFHPTETEELSVTTPDQGVADIKIKSTKTRARTATMESTSSAGASQSAFHFNPSPARRSSRRPSITDQIADHGNFNAINNTTAAAGGGGIGAIEAVIFHGVFARGSIGMTISPEWAGGDAATSFSPGNQLFSIVLGDTSKSPVSATPSDRSTSYKLITNCSTRPIIRTIVRALPELETQLSVSRGTSCVRTMLGGWPVVVAANNSVRIGAQLGLATISLNLIPFFRFVDAYLSNTEDMKQKLSVDDAAISGIKAFVDTIAKYLALDGLHLDVSLKFKMEVFHYFANSYEDRDLDTTDEASRSTDMILFLNTPSSFRPTTTSTSTGKDPSSFDTEESGDALNIRVNICLFDLIDDILSLVNIVGPKPDANGTTSPKK